MPDLFDQLVKKEGDLFDQLVSDIPEEPGFFERFIAAPARETFQASTSLIKDPSILTSGLPGDESTRQIANVLTRGLGVVGATAGSILAPLERPLENIARTAISGLEATVGLGGNILHDQFGIESLFGLGLGLPPESETFTRAAENVENIFNVTGPDRPTTGSPLGDFLSDILTAVVPVEKAFLIGKAARGLVTKADVVGLVRKEAGREAAAVVVRELPADIKLLKAAPVGTREPGALLPGGGVLPEGVGPTGTPGGLGSPVNADVVPTAIPSAIETATGAPSPLGAATGELGLPGGGTLQPNVASGGLLTDPSLFPQQPKLLPPGPSVPQGTRTSLDIQGRRFPATDITPANIAAGRDGGLPPKLVTDIVGVSADNPPVGGFRTSSIQRAVEEAEPAIPNLVQRVRSGSVATDEGFLKSVREGEQQALAFRTDARRMQKLQADVAEQSANRNPLSDVPDDVIPLEIQGGEFAILRKAAKDRDVDLTEFAQKHFGPNRTAPRTRKELKFTRDALRAMDDGPPPSGSGTPPINGGGITDDPINTYNPAKLVQSDFALPKFGVLPHMINELRLQGPTGRSLGDAVDNMLNVADRRAGNAFADLDEAIKGLSSDDLAHMRRVDDFGEVPRSDRIATAIAANKKNSKLLGDEMIANEVQVFTMSGNRRPAGLVKDFFPRKVDVDLMKKDIDELAQLLLDNSDEVTDLEDAKALVTAFSSRHAARRYGNLENAREFPNLSDKYYLTEYVPAWKLYYKQGFRRIEEIKLFGQDGEKLAPIYQQIAAEGGDAALAERMIGRITGTNKEIRKYQTASRVMRTVNIPMLGLAQVLNLSQTVTLGALRTNIASFVKTLAKTATRKGRRELSEFAQRSGVASDVIGAELAEFMGGGSKLRGGKRIPDISRVFMEGIGFGATERFNNIIAAGMGKAYAESTARSYYKLVSGGKIRAITRKRIKGFESELRRLGIDPADVVRSKSILNSDQLQRAGQQVVNDSQRFGREAFQSELTSSAFGKVLFQFKSFAVGATRLVKNETIRQARVNPVRLMQNMGKLAILFPIVGRAFKLGREGIIKPGLDEVFGGGAERDSIEAILTGFDRDDPINQKLVDGFQKASDVAGLGFQGRQWAELLASFVSDAAYVGGLGIAQDAWTAAQFGTSGALKFLAGPTGTLAAEAGISVLTADINPLAREGKRRIPVIGPSLPDVGNRKRGGGVQGVRGVR